MNEPRVRFIDTIRAWSSIGRLTFLPNNAGIVKEPRAYYCSPLFEIKTLEGSSWRVELGILLQLYGLSLSQWWPQDETSWASNWVCSPKCAGCRRQTAHVHHGRAPSTREPDRGIIFFRSRNTTRLSVECRPSKMLEGLIGYPQLAF